MMKPKPGPGVAPGPALIVCLTLALTACDAAAPAATAPAKASASTAPAPPAAADYTAILAKLDAGIARGLSLAQRNPPDTLVALEVVALHLERAQLGGDYESYARAAALLTQLARDGKPSATHCALQARLDFTLHRLKAAETALKACPAAVDAQAAAQLAGDIALQTGRYREAERIFRNLLNESPLPQHFARLATLRARTGAPAEAMALLEAAEKRYHGGSPVMVAWLRLQRGLVALDRGRLDEALALYLLAADALPGWWLIDEHRAEVLNLMGRTKEAQAIYESVVTRTGAPEFLDALSGMESAAGNTARAADLRQRARDLHDARLKQFPEAAAGHTLDHFLADPANATRAFSLAKQNFAARPAGEAAIGLARALIATQQSRAAVTLLESQLAAGWDTAELHWVLADALRHAGQTQRADAAAASALARNPLSAKMYGGST